MNIKKFWSTATLLTRLILIAAVVLGTGTTGLAIARAAFVIPTFDIVTVAPDTSVTIRTHNFPANDNFRVLMGQIGTRGVGGIFITTVSSGAGGTFTGTFNIPTELRGQRQIAIRLESPTSPYYSYNWFYNSEGGTIPDTGGTSVPGSPGLPPGVIPTFSIVGATQNATVTIRTANFPVNDTFNVTMGAMGTRGVGGASAGTWNSGAGGTQTVTFNIPAAVQGQSMIAIRLESPTSRYFSYNWFYNSSTGTIPDTGATAVPTVGPGTPTATPRPTLAPGVIPTFTITGVVRDGTVTIQTTNFPANDTFNVTMGAFGTRGVGGASAGTWNSGTGGTQTATFTIPDAVKGMDRIAIRLESPTSRYYSYNWFYNSTSP